MTDEFGHWLAGFFAGEGCFIVRQRPAVTCLSCSAHISLREDDRPILEEIRVALGFGTIRDRDYPAYNKNPQCAWGVAKM